MPVLAIVTSMVWQAHLRPPATTAGARSLGSAGAGLSGAGSAGTSSGSGNDTSDNGWITNGTRIRKALDAVARRAGARSLRLVALNAVTDENGAMLVVQVQDPKDHAKVSDYTVDGTGGMTGPTQVPWQAIADPGAREVTPAMVDRKTFDIGALPASSRLAPAITAAVRRAHIRQGSLEFWSMDAVAGSPRLLVSVKSPYGQATVLLSHTGAITRVIT
jgi:hypothetical protein